MKLYDQRTLVALPGQPTLDIPSLLHKKKLIGLKDQELHSRVCYHSFVSELLGEKKHLVSVKFPHPKNPGQTELRQLLPMPTNKFLVPGDRVPKSSIDLALTKQVNQLVVHTDPWPNIICVSQQYKNDPITFHFHTKATDEWRSKADLSEQIDYQVPDEFFEDYNGELRISLSGGSQQFQGAHMPQAKQMKTTDTAVMADHSQSIESPQTKMFYKACADKRIFAIFRREKTWMGASNNGSKDAKDDLYFHGYMYIESIGYRSLKSGEIKHRFSCSEDLAEFYKKNEQLTTFMQSSFFEVTLKPAFTPKEYKLLSENRVPHDNGYKTIEIASQDMTKVTGDFTNADLKSAADLIELFRSSDAWENFSAQQAQNVLSPESFVREQLSALVDNKYSPCVSEPLVEHLSKLLQHYEILDGARVEEARLRNNEDPDEEMEMPDYGTLDEETKKCPDYNKTIDEVREMVLQFNNLNKVAKLRFLKLDCAKLKKRSYKSTLRPCVVLWKPGLGKVQSTLPTPTLEGKI